jgi:branched-chain amino acid transport system ATP-binding protein
MPILTVERVSKSFGSLVVAKSLDVHLDDGEAVGIIGPNGAGKTTLFNLITGAIRPDAGRIYLQDRDITGLPAHARCRAGIGRSYQIPHPFANMTVFENLLVGAVFGAGRSEADSYHECVAVLERTGLLAKANVLAGALPLLDRKRLELARALVTRPRVLLLDEIAGGLTDHETQELIEIIKDIRRGGVSIIWIEHIVHALMSVVSRLIVLNFGTKLDDGDPQAVMESPAVQEVYLGIGGE